MNKRENIAWQLWLERQPSPRSVAWARVRELLPLFVRRGFAHYVSRRHMGGAESFARHLVSICCFWLALAVFTVGFRWRLK
jgi:hypothetical protein